MRVARGQSRRESRSSLAAWMVCTRTLQADDRPRPLVEGCSVRATVRLTSVAKNTVTKLLVELSDARRLSCGVRCGGGAPAARAPARHRSTLRIDDSGDSHPGCAHIPHWGRAHSGLSVCRLRRLECVPRVVLSAPHLYCAAGGNHCRRLVAVVRGRTVAWRQLRQRRAANLQDNS
jgi:hypothetical protein